MSTSKTLAFLFAVAIFTIPAIAYNHDNVVKETKMTLHMQDVLGGPNATSVIYAGIPGKLWKYDSFGATFVVDDPMTEGPDKNSREIARAQGIYVTSSLDGANVQLLFSVVFTSKEYNGSTLEIRGIFAQFLDLSEVSVVGGTGKFRFAKGFVTLETLGIEIVPTTQAINAVIRFNFTILHY